MRILLLEDEIKTARELRRIIEELSAEHTVVATLDSVRSALVWLAENPLPDLIFTDVQLADGLCFTIFEERDVRCPVIFCTAFDQYAIRAFETNGIDYVLKPFDEEKLRQSIGRYDRFRELFLPQPNGFGPLREALGGARPYRAAILVHYRENILPVAVADIAFLHSRNGIVRLHTFDGKKYVVSQTLDDLEEGLDPRLFMRANRQFLLNRDNVRTVRRSVTRRLAVHLVIESPEALTVSKAKAAAFLRWLEK